jgi:hypothetical protein
VNSTILFRSPSPSSTATNASSSSAYNKIILAYGKWIKEHVELGWDAYLFTFMFNQLHGSREARIQQMQQEIVTLYRKFVTRAVRKPTSRNWVDLLPKGVFFPDGPAYKKTKQRLRDVTVNDGLHMHGIVVATRAGRLKIGLDEHFLEQRALYQTHKMYRIHVEPINHSAVYVTGYAGKALKTPRCVNDDILILPRSVDEVSQQNCLLDHDTRKLRDIQSRFNVSDELAQNFAAQKRAIC